MSSRWYNIEEIKNKNICIEVQLSIVIPFSDLSSDFGDYLMPFLRRDETQ